MRQQNGRCGFLGQRCAEKDEDHTRPSRQRPKEASHHRSREVWNGLHSCRITIHSSVFNCLYRSLVGNPLILRLLPLANSYAEQNGESMLRMNYSESDLQRPHIAYSVQMSHYACG